MNKPNSLFIEELEARVAPSASFSGVLNASPTAADHASDKSGLDGFVATTMALCEEDNGPCLYTVV